MEGGSGPVPRSRGCSVEGLSARPPGPPAPRPEQVLPLTASVEANFLFPVLLNQIVFKTPEKLEKIFPSFSFLPKHCEI